MRAKTLGELIDKISAHREHIRSHTRYVVHCPWCEEEINTEVARWRNAQEQHRDTLRIRAMQRTYDEFIERRGEP